MLCLVLGSYVSSHAQLGLTSLFIFEANSRTTSNCHAKLTHSLPGYHGEDILGCSCLYFHLQCSTVV